MWEEGDAQFHRSPVPMRTALARKGQGSRSSGKETEKQGAPPTPGRYHHLPTRPGTFPLLGTHWPGLCSPGVGPAARRPVRMWPGCWSGVGSAGGISGPWARRAEPQQRFAGSAPSMARAAPPAARPRPPAALLPRPPPATQTGCAGRQHHLPCLPRCGRAAAPAHPRQPGPARPARATASCPAQHSGSCSSCPAVPAGGGDKPSDPEETGGLCLGPEPPNPWCPNVGESTPTRTVCGESGVRAQTQTDFGKGPATHPRRELKGRFHAEKRARGKR